MEEMAFPKTFLSWEDAMEESLCLKKRKELTNSGVLPEKLGIGYFELFTAGKKVPLIDVRKWLTFLHEHALTEYSMSLESKKR